MFDAYLSFLRVSDLEVTTRFYTQTLGLDLVLDQGRCRIFRAAPGGYLGFCQADQVPDAKGLILTLVTDDVDGFYRRLSKGGIQFDQPPTVNSEFRIYHCFFRDPDGYLLEIQRFEDSEWNAEGETRSRS